MASNIHLAVINSGSLEWKVVPFGPALTGYAANLMSPRACVGVWVQRELGGNDFWNEFSGNSAYSVVEDPSGFFVKQFDDGGQGTTRVQYFHKDGNADAIRTAEGGAALLGGGATWDVFANGNGGQYSSHLDDARAYLASNYSAPY